MTTELPKPTPSTLHTHTVVYDPGEVTTCRWCKNFITACGFADCSFAEWIHTAGSRAGSHKCGRTYEDKSASP